MKTITLARKPVVGTVASNVLAHGCGGLDIDGTRIGDSKNVPSSASRTSSGFSVQGFSDGSLRNETGNEDGHNPNVGRFPANLILQHFDGCQQDGVKRVKANQSSTIGSGKGYEETSNNGVFNAGKGGVVRASTADEDGKETVANWICELGCPVKEIDEQFIAGGMHSAGSSRTASRSAGKTGMFPMDGDGHRFGDSGGASRFFKQVKK